MSKLTPVYTVTGNNNGYIDVDLADGYITARKNVAASDGCYVEATLTTTPASGSSQAVTKTLRMKIVVDDRNAPNG